MNKTKTPRQTKTQGGGSFDLSEPKKPKKPKNPEESKESKESKESQEVNLLKNSSRVFSLGNIMFFIVCSLLFCFFCLGMYHYWGFSKRNNDLGVKVTAYNLAEVYNKSSELRKPRVFIVQELW